MQGVDFNWLAVIVAAIAAFALGGAWYSPIGFVKPWLNLLGKTQEEMQAGMTPMAAMGAQAVQQIVTTIAMAAIVSWSGAGNVLEGIWVGVVAGVGLVAADGLKLVFFESRAFKLYLINAGYSALAIVIMGAILGAWQ
jgi:hypothetical protein